MEKVVCIFGSGSGIGSALFSRFGKDPQAKTLGFSRSGEQSLDSLTWQKTHSIDLTNESELNTFQSQLKVFFAEQIFGGKNPITLFKDSKIDRHLVVYFSQGNGLFSRISDLNREDVRKHFELNVFSTLFLCQILSDYLPIFERSSFVFLGSTAGTMGFPNSSVYCASKHGVLGIARSLREEWKPYGTKVVHVGLGAVATDIWKDRPEFRVEDMISTTDCAEYLFSLSEISDSVFLNEVSITPKKGIL